MEMNSGVSLDGGFQTADWWGYKSKQGYMFSWADNGYRAYFDGQDVGSLLQKLQSDLKATNLSYQSISANDGYILFDVDNGDVGDRASGMIHIRSFHYMEENLVSELPAGMYLVAYLNAAAYKLETATALIEQMKTIVVEAKAPKPEPLPETPTIYVYFWYATPQGPRYVTKLLDVPAWEDIAANYTTDTREHIQSLVDADPRKLNGNIILWLGEPGTGKTYAIRSLGYAWDDNTMIHYIMDPEEFLNNPAYMMTIVENAEEGLSNLLVFEDAGELLTADAKERAGQGFARLLNLTDGLLGQGLHLKILITTNEDLGDMHPAIMREGRCAALQQFGDHSNEEAREWLKAHGYEDEIEDRENGWQLADLYAKINSKTSLINTETADAAQKPTPRRNKNNDPVAKMIAELTQ